MTPLSPQPPPDAARPAGRQTYSRRRFLIRTAAAGAAGLAGVPARLLGGSGRVTPTEAFDPVIESFMAARKVPGGALAIVRRKRIVYGQGYGWADRERKIPVHPDSLFRIASISKPITAVAVLQMAEQGRLDLDAKAFDLLPLKPVLASGREPDPRLRRITVRHLLQHTGGWDREKSFDPMFRPGVIAKAVGVPAPAGPEAVIRYMLGQPLDFDPGTRYAYSNFGYCVLGRILERLSGQSYAQLVQERVLAPIGIQRMQLGATQDGRQADGEVRYYTSDNDQAQSVFPGSAGKVPMPYGGFNLEAMDAHGGWIASAIDLARFAAALEDPARCPLLRPASFDTLSAPPPAPASRQADGTLEAHYYGCGWMIRPVAGRDGKMNFWHSGSLPGTATLLVRRWDGLSWAVLFNQRSEDEKLPDHAIDPALHQAADAVTDWAG